MSNWGFTNVWNESAFREDRPPVKRNNIWASEVGGAFIDRYLKMNAVPFSNPPNNRSLRKFDAGTIWEWVVELILRRAGLLISKQEWLSHQYPDLLEVTGKLDYLAGGKPNWDEAKAYFEKSADFPEFITRKAKAVIDYLSEKFPDGLEPVVLEIKSSSSFAFDRAERLGVAVDPKHEMQAFHYLIAGKYPEAHLIYICKDDARILEIGVLNPSPVEQRYREDIEKMTTFIKADQQPDKEKELTWVPDQMRFQANWKVGYSYYLTMLYGYDTTDDFNTKWDPKVAQFNRVLKRILDQANLTPANKEIIAEMKTMFPDFDNIVDTCVNYRLAHPDEFKKEEEISVQ